MTGPKIAGNTKKIGQREGETLNLLANGLTNKEISQKLNIAPRTVAQHIYASRIKLNMQGVNRTTLAMWWREHGEHGDE